MATETTKPIKPIARIPRADTLDIILNSDASGFLRMCHTLTHFNKNDFNVNNIITIEK